MPRPEDTYSLLICQIYIYIATIRAIIYIHPSRGADAEF
jgi:hypothetical protein